MKYQVLLLALMLSACGSSPAAPTIAAASIESTGQLFYDSCIGNSCSSWHFSLVNNGPGCAQTTDLSGTVRVTPQSGVSTEGKWSLTLGGKATGYFRPGETKTATNDVGTLMPGSASTYVVTVTQQTNIKCP